MTSSSVLAAPRALGPLILSTIVHRGRLCFVGSIHNVRRVLVERRPSETWLRVCQNLQPTYVAVASWSRYAGYFDGLSKYQNSTSFAAARLRQYLYAGFCSSSSRPGKSAALCIRLLSAMRSYSGLVNHQLVRTPTQRIPCASVSGRTNGLLQGGLQSIAATTYVNTQACRPKC